MAKTNVNAYKVGRVLFIGNADNGAKYTIKSVNGDSVVCSFDREGVPSMELPMTKAAIEMLIKSGKVHWADETVEEVTTADEPTLTTDATDEESVEEVNVEDVEDAEPASKPEPKPKKKPAAKKPTAKSEPKSAPKSGKYVYGEYTTKRGKTAPKIMGFSEDEPVYQNAALIGGAKSWEFVKVGGKKMKAYTVIFGTRWCDCARQLTNALNEGAGIEELQEIAETAKEALDTARAAQKEEYLEKKAERQATKEAKVKADAKSAKTAAKEAASKGEKMYTEAEVKTRIRNAFAVLSKALGIKLSDLEPLIAAA